MNEIKTCELLRVEGSSIVYDELLSYEYPWEIIPKIGELILNKIKELPLEKYEKTDTGAYISRLARVDSSSKIIGPAIICDYAEIRHGAYIRGNAIIGKGCVVGNSTEIKNAILLDNVQVPHFNYVGDSILGYKAHFGAGVIASNVRIDKKPVTIRFKGKRIETGLRKLGAIVGDNVEIGCNSVLCPGTIIGRDTNIYPLSVIKEALCAEL